MGKMMGQQAVRQQRDLLMLADDRLRQLDMVNRGEITHLLKLLLNEFVIDLVAKAKEASDE
jgi:hypothetical protein